MLLYTTSQVPKGVEWDELKVGQVLQQFRNEQGSKGQSFGAIGIYHLIIFLKIVSSRFILINRSRIRSQRGNHPLQP